MIIRRSTPIALALLLLCGVAALPVSAQFDSTTRDVTKRGTTAAEFLSIPVGARATAMSNAISASIEGPTSIYWNPAGLASMTGGAFTAEYAQWLAGIDFSYVALAVNGSFGTIGFGLTSMRVPDMEVTTVNEPDGTGEQFDASSYSVSLAYAKSLTDRFGIGGSVKLVNERIWNSTASGVAFDIGTMFETPFHGIRLGASISNFGSKMQIGGEDLLVVVDIDPNNRGNNESNRALLRTDEFDLPLVMRIGLAGEVVNNEQYRVTLAIDALNPNNSEQYVNVGAEVGLLGDLIMLRGGYGEIFLTDNVRSWSAGVGLRYRFAPLDFAIDYAYESQEFFSDISRFTLTVQF